MFISRIEMHRCVRFRVKGIETLVIKPSRKVQVVLGTNGSGKSSLLKIGFSVLPAERSDFEQGGYQKTTVLHNGGTYELSTHFEGKSPVHSFVLDGEELNQGGTGAVQRELVSDHFGMTRELHKLLTGQSKFTAMSTQERREWITKFSSANFEYVMSLYGKVKRGVRETSAVVKHLSDRLVKESSKRVDEDTYRHMRRQAEEASARLMKLHQASSRDGLEPTLDGYTRRFEALSSQVDALLAAGAGMRVSVPGGWAEGPDPRAIRDTLETLKSRVGMLQAALEELSVQHNDLDRQLEQLERLDGVDQAELAVKISEKVEAIKTLKASISDGVVFDRLPIHDYYRPVIDELISLLHEVSEDDSEYVDRVTISNKHAELNALNDRFASGTSRISELTYRLDHIRNCARVTCPQCSHSFREGVSPEEEKELQSSLAKGMSFKESMTTKITAVKEWLDRSHLVGDRLARMMAMQGNTPDLSELWGWISRSGGFMRGRALLPIINSFIRDVSTRQKVDRLEMELIPLHRQMDLIDKADKQSGLREHTQQLADRIQGIQEHLRDAKAAYQSYSKYYDAVVQAVEIGQRAEEAIAEMRHLADEMARFACVDEVSDLIRRHQAKLGMLEQGLAEAELQMGIIADIDRSLAEAKRDEAALLCLERVLSPRSGLIADQIMVFINTFVQSINDVISRIWGYNMALDRIDAEDELDYKFPFYVHTADRPVSDVSEGSDSQIDIFNQAFVLVAYKFLGLHGYPLYLDELGRTFDEVHRLNLTLALKELMDDDTYSQVLFISHSFEGQNSFPNSEVVVLDESHVSIKQPYNEHVEIF